MAALAAERNTIQRAFGAFPQEALSYAQKGSTKIFKGSIVALNAGYAAPGASAANLITVGVAQETSDNSSGLDGAATVLVKEGIFKFANHGTNTVVAANVGALCYIEDDQTVGNLSTSKSVAGRVHKLDSDGVWVKIGHGIG